MSAVVACCRRMHSDVADVTTLANDRTIPPRTFPGDLSATDTLDSTDMLFCKKTIHFYRHLYINNFPQHGSARLLQISVLATLQLFLSLFNYICLLSPVTWEREDVTTPSVDYNQKYNTDTWRYLHQEQSPGISLAINRVIKCVKWFCTTDDNDSFWNSHLVNSRNHLQFVVRYFNIWQPLHTTNGHIYEGWSLSNEETW